jgi:hypothetical protein
MAFKIVYTENALADLEAILFTLVGQTIALCGLFGGGLRPAKFHEKRLDIAACQNGKAAQ